MIEKVKMTQSDVVREYLKKHRSATRKKIMLDLQHAGTPVTLATIGYVRYKRPTLNRRPREGKSNVLAKRFAELVELNEFAKKHGGVDRVIGLLNHLKAFKTGTFSTD